MRAFATASYLGKSALIVSFLRMQKTVEIEGVIVSVCATCVSHAQDLPNTNPFNTRYYSKVAAPMGPTTSSPEAAAR
jgi:hypothetical protein